MRLGGARNLSFPAAVAAIFAATALIERAIGRVWVCKCGTIKFWHGDPNSPETSQQLTDWYSFTHIVHGLLFYLMFALVRPGWSVRGRFLSALVLESLWEILENTPFVIERYRTATIALDYTGDSILNSMGDIASMALGFAFAAGLPVWSSVSLGLALEVMLLVAIRDNLTLNVLMLIHPLEAIKAWQSAGG